MHLSARKPLRTGFNRLTQSIERLTRELRQFIQKNTPLCASEISLGRADKMRAAQMMDDLQQ